MSRVLFLNGASCAGKTSLGRALQDILGEAYLLLGLDTCFGMVPPRWAGGTDGEHQAQGFAYAAQPPQAGRAMLAITYGETGWRIMAGFHRGVAEIVRAGNPVIIDEMLLDGRVRDDWMAVLAPFRPLLVGVHCPAAELERREAARGNRPGLARWSARRSHAGMSYDLTVDTADVTPAQGARLVAGLL
jgi:chloramphenicol 3-O phosphotransferase